MTSSSAERVKDLYEDIQIVRDALDAPNRPFEAFERILHAAAGPLSGRHDLVEAARRDAR